MRASLGKLEVVWKGEQAEGLITKATAQNIDSDIAGMVMLYRIR